jgi:hypothetical protein
VNRINSIGIEPGIWEHASGEQFVVTEVLTHMFTEGAVLATDDQIVIYRDIVQDVKSHIRYGMKKSEFIVKFKKI